MRTMPLVRNFSGGPSAEAIAAIQSNFKAHPEKAQATFHSQSQLTHGLVSTGKMRNFDIKADEPEASEVPTVLQVPWNSSSFPSPPARRSP